MSGVAGDTGVMIVSADGDYNCSIPTQSCRGTEVGDRHNETW